MHTPISDRYSEFNPLPNLYSSSQSGEKSSDSWFQRYLKWERDAGTESEGGSHGNLTEDNSDPFRIGKPGEFDPFEDFGNRENYCQDCDEGMELGDRLRRTAGWNEYVWEKYQRGVLRTDTIFFDSKSNKTYRWWVEKKDTATGRIWENNISPRKWKDE